MRATQQPHTVSLRSYAPAPDNPHPVRGVAEFLLESTTPSNVAWGENIAGRNMQLAS
jgi:hypothetical protein